MMLGAIYFLQVFDAGIGLAGRARLDKVGKGNSREQADVAAVIDRRGAHAQLCH